MSSKNLYVHDNYYVVGIPMSRNITWLKSHSHVSEGNNNN